ncbi:hypothetical protein D3C80_1688880 [compost metagenome]
MAWLKSFTSSQPALRVSGTTRWIPLPPLVLRNTFRPSSSSRVRVSCVASSIAFHGSAGSGSRSRMKRSGLSKSLSVAFQVCSSSMFICTAPSRVSARLMTMAAWPAAFLS